MDRLNFTHQAKRKGFNLIEAAIVLGVVGLVIGGIWVAASAVIFNMKANEIALETLRVATAAIRLYPKTLVRDSIDANSLNFTTANVAAGLFDKSWPINNGFPQHPFGGDFRTQLFQDYIVIKVDGLDKAECIAVFTRLTASIKSGELVSVLISDGTATLGSVDKTSNSDILGKAQAWCPVTGGAVAAYFNMSMR